MTNNQARTLAVVNGTLIAASLPTYSEVVAMVDALLTLMMKERDIGRSGSSGTSSANATATNADKSLSLEIELNDSPGGANAAPESPEGQLLARAYSMVNAIKDERTGETK